MKQLTLKQRKAVTKATARRYQKSSKKQRGLILNEFCALNGYSRSYAAFLLRNLGRTVHITIGGVRTVYVFGQAAHHSKRHTVRKYDQRVLKPLKYLWALADGICGKRLAVWIRVNLPILERFEEIALDPETRQKLLTISPATIDRLLTHERDRFKLKARSRTKPGTLLKHQIPIRTFSQWDNTIPGFVEIDLVSHDGGISEGDFIQTLDVTDISSAWTETRAVRNKAQRWVFEALTDIISHLPFELKGIDSDNGSEFINAHLLRFCTQNQFNFTRSRPYRKNDSCYVEQKNWSIVRKTVGYLTYNTQQELQLLNELYGYLRLYTNFFQPVMKLAQKTRIGSKVIKKHDHPSTPFHRVLNHPSVPDDRKRTLLEQHVQLNPAQIKRTIVKLQDQLFSFAERKLIHQKHSKNLSHVSSYPYIPSSQTQTDLE
jgi:hypothetical protein